MTLGSGARLGSHEIISPLGQGGMGEVYRARDTKLGRDVAVKILPDAFAQDPDRIARFQREAQLLAALNHPHIAGIHGLEEASGIKFLVLEYVDGESLAERIAGSTGPGLHPDKGPGLHPDETLRIARQIVDALEAAHEKGIIHRDLKPANIMLTADGQVKVLDFGLAKALDPEAGPANRLRQGSGGQEAGHYDPATPGFTHSPTISIAATAAGMILGTAAYMSPEQAKGRPADKRTDVWALGCVLYEMLTGKRAFDGDDATEIIAAVVRGEPDWTRLPSGVPPRLREILQRCLVKDRKARIPEIAVIRFMLDDVRVDDGRIAASAPVATAEGSRLWKSAAALLAGITVSALATWYVTRPEAARMTRFTIAAPERGAFEVNQLPATSPAISPDGQRIAFTARDASGKVQLWVRALDSLSAQPLPGTDEASFPFWSPDSRYIAYSTRGRLMKIDITGGPPLTVCVFSAPNIIGRGGTWSKDGLIVFNNGPGPLHRVPSAGGQPVPLWPAVPDRLADAFPAFLPDGTHVLFFADAASAEGGGLHVGSLTTGESKRLAESDSGGVYDPGSGYVLFVRQNTLLGQPFDPKSLSLSGEPRPIAERVEASVFPGILTFSVSANGTLAYGVGSGAATLLQLAWIGRRGTQLETLGPPGNYRGIDLSADGGRVALHRHDGNGGDVWIMDLSGRATKLTFDATQDNSAPIWSPDGTRIAYATLRNGKWAIFQQPANNTGTDERLVDSDRATVPVSWPSSPDAIVYDIVDAKTLTDLWLLPFTGDRKPVPVVNNPGSQSHGQVSPDGKWLVYQSIESGRNEVYVQQFPSGSGKVQVSTQGGVFPRWRRDGRELFFMSQTSGGKMMAVEVNPSGSAFEAATPTELFDSGYVNISHAVPRYHPYVVSPDGQRFLIPRPVAATGSTELPIVVVENWREELKQR